MMSTEEKLLHYQRSIDRSRHDKSRLKHCIEVLYKLPVTIPLLQSTGIGRTINSLCHRESGVREAAKQLISKWRALVRDADPNSADEDEACVPDVPESYAASESDGDLENTAKRKSEFQQSEKDSELKSPSKNKHLSSKDKYESSKDSKDSEANLHKRKDKNKSESSTSSSNKDKKRVENRKRKYDSSSSDGDNNERKKVKNSNNYEEDENLEEDEEDSFMIVDNKLSDEEVYSKEVDEVDEEDYKKTKEDKKSSLKDKTKLHESCDKSKRKEKNSSSKLDKQDKEEKHRSNEHSKESSKIKSSHSSSSNKDHSKDKDKSKHKDKHRSTEKHSDRDKHSKSKGKELISSTNKEDKEKLKENKEQKESKSKESRQHKHKEHKDKQEKRKAKVHKNNDGGIDCNSGTSFAEALGMCTLLPPSKKKKENSSSKSSKTEQPLVNYSSPSTASSSRASSDKLNDTPDPPHLLTNSKSLLSPNVRLEPLNELAEEIDLAATLPEPSPYYKPLQPINYLQRRQDEDDMLSQVIHAKNQRTKVFSGNKIGCTTLPTLYEMCIRVLIENIDALEFTGGVPYYIIKPVLERATPDQLFMLEHHNPYLIEESDLLWKFHCSKDFRTKQREEMETWREMYMRCLDEREAKLKLLTANIKQSIDKSAPVRSTKLAYVDNVVKPPRSVLRKQAKYGTANVSTNVSDLKKKLITSGASTSSTSSTSSGSNATVQAPRISVPPPPVARSRAPATVTKKTKAPLMAKALQAIRGRYRR